ncbi:TPA: hypothetical protein N0F65_012198 [Lagenidium giganteum]|uniref:Inositol-3,4-bisphosphate 4-phosphatase n=1 Tax=Lagenidium giganteum TaxID=4803 RepID=A0AAV2ZFK0_9STRA|nr:TPA: hypothetical protein N0F65_012198 [Lagenidium giganteum]
MVAADDAPNTVGYMCQANKCIFAEDPSQGTYKTAVECAKACGRRTDMSQGIESSLVDVPAIKFTSSLDGTCTNCSMVATTNWNFPKMLSNFDLTSASLASSDCKFKCQVTFPTPPSWKLEGDSSTCSLGDSTIDCSRQGNTSTLTLKTPDLTQLMTPARSYKFSVDSASTSLPGTFIDPVVLGMRFDGTGCLATVKDIQRQYFALDLSANMFTIVGNFTETKMKATNKKILGTTSITMSFRSGAVLRAGSFILLRVAKVNEELFGSLIQGVSNAKMKFKDKTMPMDLRIGAKNLSFTIPASFTGDINNGDPMVISFDGFKNPADDSAGLNTAYLSAYQGYELAVNISPIEFFPLQPAERALKAAGLDIVSVVVFGLCFLLSLIIIRWHGLPLTMTTLWTDMVAISSLFSFATGCGGSLVWVLEPSKAYVHWYAAQYFFNTVMIMSLCFHWASVLSFKCFKKLTLKSPAVLCYFIVNAAVLAFIIACSVFYNDKLHCVFDQKALQCSSAEECTEPLAAGGKRVRNAVRECGMQTYYLALGGGFIIYTLMLMVLGCMVMSRGRTLMLNEDPSDSRIRKSLTIFYSIIATTCVLYISAQVIYIAQYVTLKGDRSELSDVIWYIFIIWLPQGFPPLLLLFLQWNPSTETLTPEEEDALRPHSSKDDVFNLTPRSSGSSPNMHYSKWQRERLSLAESILNNEEPGNKLRVIVRMKLPASFDRACFVSLDYYHSKESIAGTSSLRDLSRSASWKCVGTTERVGIEGEVDSMISSHSTHAIYPFVAVLEVPVVGPASNTLLRFMVHASTIGKRDANSGFMDMRGSSMTQDSSSESKSDNSTPLSYQMTMFQPLLEFVTSSQAVLDAAASGQPLNVYPTEDHTCTVLDELPTLKREIDTLLGGNMRNAELSVQTVMMPGEAPAKDDVSSHKNIGNIIRFFQYDSEDGNGGLVVEDLQESTYSNSIPRQLLEVIAAERQDQVEKAREELHAFLNQKKDKQDRGFYGTLIGQIQDEGDTTQAREWLEARLKKRKEYLSMIRKNIQFLVNRDKHKQYFKASVEKKSDELRFVPINLHIQDLLIGPTSAFINDEKRRSSKEVATYDFTTVGAPAAHCYKFNKGGILSYQTRLKKLQEKLTASDVDLSKWPEEVREYDDLQWDLQLRMDSAFAQALAALTCSFVRKVEVAIQNPDVNKGEDMLRQWSTLGFLFHLESLLSTHGKEIGMIEDMAGSVAHLACVAFVIKDVRDKPKGRFSFRVSQKKDVVEDAQVVKVTVSQKNPKDARRSSIKYIVTVQVMTGEVELPDRLASGGEISVTPVLFTQGINEMQTIANNTERAKTELQDMININNLRPLKQFCEKYCRLAVAMPSAGHVGHGRMSQPRYKTMNQAPMRMTEDQVMKEFQALETCVLDAAQSLVKTKRPDILKRSSDLCRELGAGRVTICKSAKDRTAMSVTLEQVRILHRHHDLPAHRIPATVSVMRSHGVRIENALKNTGKRQFAFNKLQRSLLPEEYRCPDQVGGTGNVS